MGWSGVRRGGGGGGGVGKDWVALGIEGELNVTMSKVQYCWTEKIKASP